MPGTCPRRARHLPKTRRDASYLRPGRNSVPGTCPRRGGMLAICGLGRKSMPGGNRCQAPARTRLDASNLQVARCAGQIVKEPGARHLSKARRDASNLLTGLELGARHLSKARRDASNLLPGWNSVPGTCPIRGGMLAICGRAPRARDPSELVLT